MSYREINKCRVCGNTNLVSVFDLGLQSLTGVFPKPFEEVEKVPVHLVKCHGKGCCGLVQLKHSVEPEKMYGDNYGYRSGLNKSMISHLEHLYSYCCDFVELESGDLILDIGSNDGTLLNIINSDLKLPPDITLVGMDPTIKKFGNYYNDSIIKISDFFSASSFLNHFNDTNRKAKMITSISCFYDLEDPISFAKDIKRILHPSGVWVFEQSYSLLMLAKNMVDTICHEHLDYYSLSQISYILSKAGLEIESVELNNCNAGSFRVVAVHKRKSLDGISSMLLLSTQEEILGLDELAIYKNFKNNVESLSESLLNLLFNLKERGKRVYGLGASTKFNVILQYCDIDTSLITAIGEVNKDKFGRVTPGTEIPIIPEREALERADYLVVGIYQFRDFLLELDLIKEFLNKGGKLIFPLPALEIISKEEL